MLTTEGILEKEKYVKEHFSYPHSYYVEEDIADVKKVAEELRSLGHKVEVGTYQKYSYIIFLKNA